MRSDLFERINSFLNKPIKNKHVRYGIPFMAFMAFGFFLLSQVGTTRYEFRKSTPLDKEEMKRLGIKFKDGPSITLEEAYEEYLKHDLDDWKNIRGPRMWDETPTN